MVKRTPWPRWCSRTSARAASSRCAAFRSDSIFKTMRSCRDLACRNKGSIIVVIGTDAPLTPVLLRRLAKRGALGIGRTGTSGGHYSGDLMLAFSHSQSLRISSARRGAAAPARDDLAARRPLRRHLRANRRCGRGGDPETPSWPPIPSRPSSPPGLVLEAIDHGGGGGGGRLLEVMRRYGRLRV